MNWPIWAIVSSTNIKLIAENYVVEIPSAVFGVSTRAIDSLPEVLLH